MNFNEVIELVKTVSNSELTSFQYEEGGQKIIMQAGNVVSCVTADNEVKKTDGTNREEHLLYGAQNQGVSADRESTDNNTVQAAQISGNQVISPLVGRFYAAPSEEAEAFVKVGDTVKKGQVLAIVEAMKLMNEIESEYDGTVTNILVQDGEAVEYGQPLFVIA